MAEIYCCDKASILNHAKKLGYINHYRPELTDKDRQDIIDKYYTYKAKDLANIYHCSESLIIKIWHEANIVNKKSRRVYTLNENIFNEINTPEKAYFLGLLSADGCVSINKHKQNTLKLSLQYKDIEIIKKFQQFLHTDKPIRIFEQHRDNFIGKYADIEISSDMIVNDLTKYNLFQNHTYSFRFCIFDEPFMSHYVRGYFDGDGSIYFTTRDNRCVCSLVGYYDNLVIVQNYLQTKGITLHWVRDNRQYNGGEFGQLRTNNRKECYNLIRYLYYDDNDLCLQRKKEKANIFLSTYN